MKQLACGLTVLGAALRHSVSGLGQFVRFFVTLLARSGSIVVRPGLVTRQGHFLGNYS